MLRRDVLRYQKDFDRIYKKGRSVGERHVVVFFKKNGLDYTRKSFLASKKVGNSVTRNRARRLMKEAFRLGGFDLEPGYDVIIIARNGIDAVKCQEVEKSLASALAKAGVLRKEK